MKKLIGMFICLLLLAGCAAQPPVETTQAPAETTQAPTETTQAPAEITLPPDTQAPADGVLKAARAAEVDFGKLATPIELTLEEDGERVALYVEGRITGFVLERGSWDENAVQFTPEETLFLAQEMGNGAVLLFTTQVGDALPHLRVTYTGPEGEIQRYLFQSGEDGSILLVE